MPTLVGPMKQEVTFNNLLKPTILATITQGWLQKDSYGFKNWSTFTTTFPGPDPTWIKVFSVDCACPGQDPPIEDCDIFMVQGANIVLFKELNAPTLLATAPQQYTDIAIIGNKLYGRRFGGSLDEWTINTNSIELTTPNIFNIGNGTALGSDATHLIYDVAMSGLVYRIQPGVWTPQPYTGQPNQSLQGDLMVVGSNQMAFSTFEDVSTMKIWTNTLPPTEVQSFQILDDSEVIIPNVYGMFQKDSKLYIVTADGRFYSMSDEAPIRFTYQGQVSHSGTFYSDWNGAAQRGACGTITPPQTAIPFTISLINEDNVEVLELEDVTIGSALSDILTNANLAPLTTYTGSTPNSQQPYNFQFTLAGDTPTMNLSVIMSLDGGADTEVDTAVLNPGDTYSNSFSPSPTISIKYKLNLTIA